MNFIDLLDSHSRFVVHTGCSDDLKQFLNNCEELGLNWVSRAATEFVPGEYGDSTCIYITPARYLEYSPLDFFQANVHKYGPIFELSDLVFEEKAVETISPDSLFSVLTGG